MNFGENEGRASGLGFRKVLLCFFFFFKYCADVEICESFKNFGFIYILITCACYIIINIVTLANVK